MAWKRVSAGARRHRLTLANPGPPEPDGQGGYTQSWVPLKPAEVYASITQATAWNLERLTASTVQSTATHVLTFPYHPQVTTKTRITYQGRVFRVSGVINPNERRIETQVVADEVVE